VSVIGIAVPNLNQGRFLAAALESLRGASHRVVVAVLDAGSTDESARVIDAARDQLSYVRSHPDAGQAAAVNEGVAALVRQHPDVELVGWLNADDVFLGQGLSLLADALERHPDWVAVAGRGRLADEAGVLGAEIATAPFDPTVFARWCSICQPATLVRRQAWQAVQGLDASLDMCFDFDLWWRLSHVGPIGYVDAIVAASRDHGATKTRTRRPVYFAEARRIVARERGAVPWHWFISEALEREAGFDIDRRVAGVAKARAAARAAVAFVRHRLGGVS
jgi:GT2 family glycosyltransferase